MRTLKEAWDWYQAALSSLRVTRRLAAKHWATLDWDPGGPLARDDHLNVEGDDLLRQADLALEHLKDLAIVVLFSVFESTVRQELAARMSPDLDRVNDPIVKNAVEEAIQGVNEGSFYNRVLGPLRGTVDPDLVTMVDQVRDYRNWVAHGRRDEPTNAVDPKSAYVRLKRFLQAIGIPTDEGPAGGPSDSLEQGK